MASWSDDQAAVLEKLADGIYFFTNCSIVTVKLKNGAMIQLDIFGSVFGRPAFKPASTPGRDGNPRTMYPMYICYTFPGIRFPILWSADNELLPVSEIPAEHAPILKKLIAVAIATYERWCFGDCETVDQSTGETVQIKSYLLHILEKKLADLWSED